MAVSPYIIGLDCLSEELPINGHTSSNYRQPSSSSVLAREASELYEEIDQLFDSLSRNLVTHNYLGSNSNHQGANPYNEYGGDAICSSLRTELIKKEMERDRLLYCNNKLNEIKGLLENIKEPATTVRKNGVAWEIDENFLNQFQLKLNLKDQQEMIKEKLLQTNKLKLADYYNMHFKPPEAPASVHHNCTTAQNTGNFRAYNMATLSPNHQNLQREVLANARPNNHFRPNVPSQAPAKDAVAPPNRNYNCRLFTLDTCKFNKRNTNSHSNSTHSTNHQNASNYHHTALRNEPSTGDKNLVYVKGRIKLNNNEHLKNGSNLVYIKSTGPVSSYTPNTGPESNPKTEERQDPVEEREPEDPKDGDDSEYYKFESLDDLLRYENDEYYPDSMGPLPQFTTNDKLLDTLFEGQLDAATLQKDNGPEREFEREALPAEPKSSDRSAHSQVNKREDKQCKHYYYYKICSGSKKHRKRRKKCKHHTRHSKSRESSLYSNDGEEMTGSQVEYKSRVIYPNDL